MQIHQLRNNYYQIALKVRKNKITIQIGDKNMINYKKSKPVKMEASKVVTDPRSETSIRGKSALSTGNKNPVKGSGAARKQKDITWY